MGLIFSSLRAKICGLEDGGSLSQNSYEFAKWSSLTRISAATLLYGAGTDWPVVIALGLSCLHLVCEVRTYLKRN